jgi:hypothetical protein
MRVREGKGGRERGARSDCHSPFLTAQGKSEYWREEDSSKPFLVESAADSRK